MTEYNETIENSFDVASEVRTPGNDGDLSSAELNPASATLEPRSEHASQRDSASSAGKWTVNVNAERTLAERAYAAIYSAIIDGTFAPGDRLRIEDLSGSLHISPTPIREALNRLEAAGLAEHVAHRGSRVSMVSAAEFQQLYELRFILEPLAVAKAAKTFTKEEASVARKYLEQLTSRVQEHEVPEAWDAHTAFHFTLYRAAKSRWLERLIVPLWDSCRRYRMQQSNLLASPVQNRAEHEKILAACMAHDPGTAWLEMYNHTARNANVIAKHNFGEEFFTLKDEPPPEGCLGSDFEIQAAAVSPMAGPVRREPQSAK
jgi:DNA-binding GntR family transcriptional regulator